MVLTDVFVSVGSYHATHYQWYVLYVLHTSAHTYVQVS